jgi:lysophospholipase L1-like esterase
MNSLRTCAHLIAFLLTACGLAGTAQAFEVPDPDPTRFDTNIHAFEAWDRQNSYPRDAVLFVGSSSIRMWQTVESFPDMPVINRGFGGSHISDVNHFAERIVLKYNPRLIVFYAGDNDIASGKPPQQVYDDFLEFIRLVQKRLDKTPIVFIAIKPSIARRKLWPQMKEANTFVWRLAGINSQVIYLDVATPMLAGREVPAEDLFLDDGLHLNDKGYAVWNSVLAPVLQSDFARPRAEK